jgi:hypothetical protein
MAGFDENIVREYFELNGFLVRQLRKYRVQARKKRSDEEIDLVVMNPDPEETDRSPGFQLFSNDVKRIRRAVVVVKGWHTAKFTPTMLKSSTRIFNFLKKDVLDQVGSYFRHEEGLLEEIGSLQKILVLPGLPSQELQRQESIELLRSQGVDAILTFRTILENIFRTLEPNQNYSKSDLLQLMRILKIYDMVKDPQMDLFRK